MPYFCNKYLANQQQEHEKKWKSKYYSLMASGSFQLQPKLSIFRLKLNVLRVFFIIFFLSHFFCICCNAVFALSEPIEKKYMWWGFEIYSDKYLHIKATWADRLILYDLSENFAYLFTNKTRYYISNSVFFHCNLLNKETPCLENGDSDINSYLRHSAVKDNDDQS